MEKNINLVFQDGNLVVTLSHLRPFKTFFEGFDDESFEKIDELVFPALPVHPMMVIFHLLDESMDAKAMVSQLPISEITDCLTCAIFFDIGPLIEILENGITEKLNAINSIVELYQNLHPETAWTHLHDYVRMDTVSKLA